MERYKVILVDDEEEVIDVMEAKIRWNELGFEVVGLSLIHIFCSWNRY